MTFTQQSPRGGDPVLSAVDPLADLGPMLDGTVLRPHDEDFQESAAPWNRSVEQRPQAVVLASTAQDVVRTVRFAHTHGLRVSAQPSGHGATDSLEDVVLIRTGALDDVWIDAQSRVARVGAGVTWGALMQALDGTGLVGLAGSSPGISVVGFCLGGGMSWFSRRFGTGASSLRAVELVDPLGMHRWVTEERDPDLMWALRGGGGDFGIVTAVEIDLFPAPQITGGRLAFPAEDAGEVLRAFGEVTSVAPDTLSLWASVTHFPPLPFLPEEIRGRSFCFVDAVHLGGPEELGALLAPIRAAGPVLRDTVRPLLPSELGAVCEEPEDPSAATHTAMAVTVVDENLIDRVLGLAGAGVATPLFQVQLRHLGGALRRAGRGCAGPIHGDYLAVALAMLPDPALRDPVAAALSTLRNTLGPWASGPSVLSMLSSGDPASSAFDDATIARLRAIKRSTDPAGLVRGNYPVGG
ncbi:FAD-binding oxidoreductase [Rhodococcus maanshanensis]|uniref:FAD/FMN-containing dehydrogenase n=1 Tax=Rhodococcus maanshanensis TaxID=183556 RepID=A0A1H7N1J5_9NOCA|nr:FAD-binding oxidoreductase [Rhodococcus maanshanensis]SEL17442.1 FAD/FMN-containing dehydrogenase [Rhodococcus maanshanensis]